MHGIHFDVSLFFNKLIVNKSSNTSFGQYYLFFCKFDDKYERLANQGIYFMHFGYECAGTNGPIGILAYILL